MTASQMITIVNSDKVQYAINKSMIIQVVAVSAADASQSFVYYQFGDGVKSIHTNESVESLMARING